MDAIRNTIRNMNNLEKYDASNAKIDINRLRYKKLFLTTPMYGGQCSGVFTQSMIALTNLLTTHKIQHCHHFLFNESLVTRARNYCVDEFLRSDCTHMMFIDSDIGFKPVDVLTMLEISDGENILCGPYPKKTISWEKIKAAVEQGKGDNDPFELENFVGDYVFNSVERSGKPLKVSKPFEVMEGGTGFMMMPRLVLEKYAEAYPEYRYKPDHSRTEHFDGSREITAFFDTIIDPESKRYLSEDYMFCQQARKIGIKVWICPWMELRHVGSYIFGGSLAALGSIRASPTSSKESNKKHYKKKSKSKKKGQK